MHCAKFHVYTLNFLLDRFVGKGNVSTLVEAKCSRLMVEQGFSPSLILAVEEATPVNERAS